MDKIGVKLTYFWVKVPQEQQQQQQRFSLYKNTKV